MRNINVALIVESIRTPLRRPSNVSGSTAKGVSRGLCSKYVITNEALVHLEASGAELARVLQYKQRNGNNKAVYSENVTESWVVVSPDFPSTRSLT